MKKFWKKCWEMWVKFLLIKTIDWHIVRCESLRRRINTKELLVKDLQKEYNEKYGEKIEENEENHLTEE